MRFVATVATLLAVLGVASFSIRDKDYLTARNLRMMRDYFRYRVELASAVSGGNVFTAVASLIRPEVFVSNASVRDAVSLPVLVYHGILTEAPDGFNTLRDDFVAQMFALKQAGYRTVSLEEAYAFLRGERALPERSILLTFDDGRKDSYYHADPVLNVLGFRAVMFVITRHSIGERSGSAYYLSERELHAMAASERWEIAPHAYGGHDDYPVDAAGTPGHFYSNLLWLSDPDAPVGAGEGRLETVAEFRARITEDFIAAKQDVERAFGHSALAFAFPFGDYGWMTENFPGAEQVVLEAVADVYPLAFYQRWSDESSENSPNSAASFYFARRIKVDPAWDSAGLLAALEHAE